MPVARRQCRAAACRFRSPAEVASKLVVEPSLRW